MRLIGLRTSVGIQELEQIEGWTFEYDRKIDMLYAESQEYKYMQEASTA